MKRLLSTALAGLLLVAFATGAFAAGPYTYKLSTNPLAWRTHKAAIVGDEGPTYGVDASGGFIDSLSFYVPNAADGQDTSVVWQPPGDFARAAAGDSLPPFILEIRNSAAGASGDTLHLGVEPLVGGSSVLARAAFPTAINRALTGAITGARVWLFPALPAGSYAGSETAASTNPVSVQVVPGLFNGFRVRAYGDGTAAVSGGGQVTVYVWYLSTLK